MYVFRSSEDKRVFIYSGLCFIYTVEALLHHHVRWFICNFLSLFLSLFGLHAPTWQQILSHCHSCRGNKLCFVFIASIRLSDTEREPDSFCNLLYPSFTCVSSSRSSVMGFISCFMRLWLKYYFYNLQRSHSFNQRPLQMLLLNPKTNVKDNFIPHSNDKRLLLCSSILMRTCADVFPSP